MFTETFMDHFNNPRYAEDIENPDAVGVIGDPGCGDFVRVMIKVKDHKITDLACKTFGCAAAIATSSAATEMVVGKTFEEIIKIEPEDVVTFLGGLPEAKQHCSNLAIYAIRLAIKNYLEAELKAQQPPE